jgi:hypothetical protein
VHVVELPAFLADLDFSDPRPGGRWELAIHFDHPDLGAIAGLAVLDVVVQGRAFRAHTALVWTQGATRGPDNAAEAEGTRDEASVDLVLHVHEEEMRQAPFVCRGVRSEESGGYEGGWTLACLNPSSCRGVCEGASGAFTLRRST